MNRKSSADLQPSAAVGLCYRLLDVQLLRDDPRDRHSERAFLETEQHVLILSNAHGGSLIIDGRLHVVRPGSLFVCAPGQLIEWTNYSGHPLELLLLHFRVFAPPSLETTSASFDELPPRFPFRGEAAMPSAMAAGHFFGLLGTGWSQGTASARLRCEAALLELLSLALNQQERQTELALEAARMELERHYASEITIVDLARTAGLSRYHFMRLFKERFGKGAMEYRTDLRLQEAKRLMGMPDLTLAEIVERIGYTSESYFSSLFKKQVGFAPAVYQRNQKRRIAAYSWVNVGQLLALRTIPFAAPMDQYWTEYYRNKFGYEVTVPLSHHYEFNRGALRSARPDLIVGIDAFIPAEEQDRLKEIAPALFLGWECDWRSHLASLAAFLEREGEAEAWLKRYDRKAAFVRERLEPAIGRGTLLVLVVSRGQLSVWGRQAGTVLYDDLCFVLPGALSEVVWNKPIEAAELTGLPADRILVHVDRNAAAEARWDGLTQTAAWCAHPAVQAGNVHRAAGNGCFEAPWNEYAADPLDRFLEAVPGWSGIRG